MPRRRHPVDHAHVGEKDLWHPYGLQSLSGDKFTRVVNRILDGRYRILVNNERISDSNVLSFPGDQTFIPPVVRA